MATESVTNADDVGITAADKKQFDEADAVLAAILAQKPEPTARRRVSSLPSNAVRFPKPMKRGAKVRKGPSATITQLPTALTGVRLLEEWSWMRQNCGKWENEKLSGRASRKDWERSYDVTVAFAVADERPIPTAQDLRRELVEGRATIERHIALKDWLESLGFEFRNNDDPLRALYFLFERMQAQADAPGAA